MPFYTRPNFEDRQVVQYDGTSITLSGETNINSSGKFRIYKDAAPGLVATSLDFDGTVVWGPVSGLSWSISACTSPFYVNNIVACPTTGGTIQVDAGNLALNSQLNFLIGLSAGTTSDNVLVIGGDGYIRSVSQASITPIFTGGTGSCITDLYVTNIHGCSPLNIQPTSPDNVIIAKGGGNVGIGTSPSNSYRLHVSGRTNTELRFADSGSTPSFSVTTNNNNKLISSQVWDTTSNSTFGLVFRGFNEPNFDEYGKQGDATLYASVNANGLNIMNNNGTGKEDYIRFYAGTNAQGPPDMHMQGTGATRGFIGMGTVNPQSKLDVSGKTRTTTLQVTSGATIGYVLTAIDSNGNASWQPSSVGTFTGNTSGDCITDLYVRNLHGCSPIYVHDILSGNSTNNFLDLSSYSDSLVLQTQSSGLNQYIGMGGYYTGGIRLESSPNSYMDMTTFASQLFGFNSLSFISTNKSILLENKLGVQFYVGTPNSNEGSLFFVKSNYSGGGGFSGGLTGGTLQGEIVLGKPLYANTTNLGLPIGVMGTGLGVEQTGYAGATGYDYFPVFISTPRSRAYDDVDYSSIKNVLFGGGSNNIVYTGVTNSALIGGSGNTINSYLKNTVVLAGEAITATTSNTVYVPDLVIKKSASVPTTSGDTVGDIGSVTWDNTYLYVKTNNGWGRTLLDYGF